MKKLIVAALALFGMMIPAAAQGTAEVLTFNIREAQEYAVEHNRTLMNASIDIQKAQAAKWQAIAAMLPQVKGTTDYSTNFGYKMDLGQMQISMPQYITFGLNTAVALNGGLIVTAQIAEISKQMADVTLHKSEKKIKDQVKELYVSALVVEKTIGILEKNLESLRRLYEMTSKTVEVGVSEQTQADQLQVQVATMESTVNSTKRSLEMAYNSLRLALCLDENVELKLTDNLDELVDIAAITALFGEEFDINRNYDYQLLMQNTDIAKKKIAQTLLTNGPTLSIFHQYNAKKYLTDEATMNMTPPNMMGATLSIPIFTSLKTTMARKDAKLAYEKQLNTVADTELSLRIQYRQLVYNLRSNLEKLDLQKQGMDVAQRVFDNISKKFENGIASSLEVTNSSTSLLTAESNYVQAILEVVNAKISLEELLNK